MGDPQICKSGPTQVLTCTCSCFPLSSRMSSALDQPQILLILQGRRGSCHPWSLPWASSAWGPCPPPPHPSRGCYLGHSFRASRDKAATQIPAMSSPATTVKARRRLRAAGRGKPGQTPISTGAAGLERPGRGFGDPVGRLPHAVLFLIGSVYMGNPPGLGVPCKG